MRVTDYRIRITRETVSVQHRVRRPSWEVWLLIPVYMLIIFLNGGFRVLANLVREAAWGLLVAAILLYGAFILLFSWSWLIYSSGEFMRCDANELQFARRRFWTHWRRRSFTTKDVAQLSFASRGGSKTRYYTVLTFRAGGKQNDVLEDISPEDASRVLAACKSLGYECVTPELFRNYDGPMNADIDKRGWWVKPWRPVVHGEHPKEQ